MVVAKASDHLGSDPKSRPDHALSTFSAKSERKKKSEQNLENLSILREIRRQTKVDQLNLKRKGVGVRKKSAPKISQKQIQTSPATENITLLLLMSRCIIFGCFSGGRGEHENEKRKTFLECNNATASNKFCSKNSSGLPHTPPADPSHYNTYPGNVGNFGGRPNMLFSGLFLGASKKSQEKKKKKGLQPR